MFISTFVKLEVELPCSHRWWHFTILFWQSDP